MASGGFGIFNSCGSQWLVSADIWDRPMVVIATKLKGPVKLKKAVDGDETFVIPMSTSMLFYKGLSVQLKLLQLKNAKKIKFICIFMYYYNTL